MAGKIIHGGTNHPLYGTWNLMHQRCKNPSVPNYDNYGGRGIYVCERWHDFWAFVEDVGERPEGCTLDRYPDNNGPYAPDNFRWATRKQQNSNKRIYKNSMQLTFRGETKSPNQWAKEMDITVQALIWRLNRGWSVEKALSTPHGGRGPKKH